MDNNKIGNLIKELRKKSGLTQKQFAEKYNVTFQAVSKWEVGKNIPDMSILKDICRDYNVSLDNVLNVKKYRNTKKIKIILLSIIILLIGTFLFLILNNNNEFQYRTISSKCNDFKLSGSIAYNKNKSYLSINSVTHCDELNDKVYSKIECILFEKKNNTISSLDKIIKSNIDLSTFLENIQFELDDFSNNCNDYDDNSLYLEINAYDDEEKIVKYNIPLTLNNICNK